MVLYYFKVLCQHMPVELTKLIPVRTANIQAENLTHNLPNMKQQHVW